MDPELEPFIPLFPPADLSDPDTARKHLAELTRAAPAPDTTELEIDGPDGARGPGCGGADLSPAGCARRHRLDARRRLRHG